MAVTALYVIDIDVDVDVSIRSSVKIVIVAASKSLNSSMGPLTHGHSLCA
jgi:hypothetical protein